MDVDMETEDQNNVGTSVASRSVDHDVPSALPAPLLYESTVPQTLAYMQIHTFLLLNPSPPCPKHLFFLLHHCFQVRLQFSLLYSPLFLCLKLTHGFLRLLRKKNGFPRLCQIKKPLLPLLTRMNLLFLPHQISALLSLLTKVQLHLRWPQGFIIH
jgi:hypothetical protein